MPPEEAVPKTFLMQFPRKKVPVPPTSTSRGKDAQRPREHPQNDLIRDMPVNPMPTHEAPDDIFALFSRFDLDMSQYRVFERENALKPAETSVEEFAAEPFIEMEAAEAVVSRRVEESHPVLVGRAETVEKASPRNALANLQRSLRSREPLPVSSARVAVPVAICGSAGGVGVTTVAATLARHLSREGRCGLYDRSSESLLPLYFGNQQIATHHHRFAGLHSVLGPSVRFLSPAMCEGNPEGNDSDVPAVALTPSEKIARHFESEFDHILFDAGREPHAIEGCLKLYVAIPDVSSVVGIQRLLGRREGRMLSHQAICVLNRFDSSLALHQELRCWYEDHFEEVITVDHSPLIAEALAEGVTVLDWAPEADASADFIRLANAIRRAESQLSSAAFVPPASASKTQSEAHKTPAAAPSKKGSSADLAAAGESVVRISSEGLALCS